MGGPDKKRESERAAKEESHQCPLYAAAAAQHEVNSLR
jgi:hypothetical protein